MLFSLKIDPVLFILIILTMFPITKFRVKRSFAEKVVRKTELALRQQVRDKRLRIDRRLKEIWSNP